MHDPLPVIEVLPRLKEALESPGVAVLVAPPGSGKTTVVPLEVIDEPWLSGRKILVLEPRRLATRAAARRMADLLGESVGDTVGYATRDDRQVGPGTRIEVITEGILTRRLQHDPELSDVGLVVFDEFHERNLQTDLGLAFTLDVRDTIRADLRIMVMSATMDAHRVAGILSEPAAPVIESSARSHHVDIRWVPLPRRGRLERHVASVVNTALAREIGDVLVFLPGMAEIQRVAGILEDSGAPCEIHRLHGSLPIADQDAAISPSMRRKVVLSTDIAETSLTVEGIRIVVDAGLARSPRFDARTGMTRLRTVQISRASAEQRSGRAGRTEPGVAYRLWSKVEHGTRRAHIDPDITQVDLASLVLEVKAWGTTDQSSLRFLDAPPTKAWDEASRLLTRLGALTAAGQVTDLGAAMTGIPAHPRLARMILESGGWTACVLAALLEERDPIRGSWSERPVDLTLRAGLIDGSTTHPETDGRALERIRRVALDLARRAEIRPGSLDPDAVGVTLALAFPDRLAIRRGSPGRFQLRSGGSAWLPSSDPLAAESFLVAGDVDGRRRDARIRLAAAIDAQDVTERFADEIQTQVELIWDEGRVVEVRHRRIGGITLDDRRRRAEPGPEVAEFIAGRLRSDPSIIRWSPHAEEMRTRIAFLRRTYGDPWPDWSDPALAADLDAWLGPSLHSVTSLGELERLDPGRMLERTLHPRLRNDLDRLAPTHLSLPNGRRLRIDYGGEDPSVESRVQDFFGVHDLPTVGDRPLLVRLLSPAGRPIQITRDLDGFWKGSWLEVRKEMAGRYPKHDWPEHPG